MNFLPGVIVRFTVQPSSLFPDQVEPLRDLFTQEWGQIDVFDGFVQGREIPRPLVALDANGNLLGGLAFTAYRHPSTEDLALWINALYVIASWRRNGIASRLIQAAGTASQELGFDRLHVYTDASHIYQRLGWYLVSESGQHRVLVSSR